MELTEVDPEVAAANFAADLDLLWAGGRPEERGWKRTRIDALTEIIEMPARLADGTQHPYFVKLHASHYGPHPARVTFVEPESWAEAAGDSRWLPRLEGVPAWFGLHATYAYPDGAQRQLVCFSFNLDYYVSNHSPQPTELWKQGHHTLAATLNRLHEMLGPDCYQGPAGPPAAAAPLAEAA